MDAVRDNVGELTDVDTSAAAQNYRLIYNGTQWIAAPEDTTYTFSITSFSDTETTTQLVGSGVWRTAGAIDFTAGYDNGPPASGHVALTSTGGVTWGSDLTLVSPFTAGSSNESTDYTIDKDKTITFTLNANVGDTDDTDTEVVTFRNNIYWGIASGTGPYSSDTVINLAGSILSNDQTRSVSVNSTAGSYILFAHPSSYTSINDAGFLFNSVICPFETPDTVAVTNDNSFVENYKVYRATGSALGNSTLTTSTSDTTKNWTFWGTTSGLSGFTEADIEGVPNGGSQATNTIRRDFTVTAGAGSYIMYNQPTRLGSLVFYVGGFEGGFESPETVGVTNPNGFAEDYYVYRSTNAGLGETNVNVSGA